MYAINYKTECQTFQFQLLLAPEIHSVEVEEMKHEEIFAFLKHSKDKTKPNL